MQTRGPRDRKWWTRGSSWNLSPLMTCTRTTTRPRSAADSLTWPRRWQRARHPKQTLVPPVGRGPGSSQGSLCRQGTSMPCPWLQHPQLPLSTPWRWSRRAGPPGPSHTCTACCAVVRVCVCVGRSCGTCARCEVVQLMSGSGGRARGGALCAAWTHSVESKTTNSRAQRGWSLQVLVHGWVTQSCTRTQHSSCPFPLRRGRLNPPAPPPPLAGTAYGQP